MTPRGANSLVVDTHAAITRPPHSDSSIRQALPLHRRPNGSCACDTVAAMDSSAIPAVAALPLLARVRTTCAQAPLVPDGRSPAPSSQPRLSPSTSKKMEANRSGTGIENLRMPFARYTQSRAASWSVTSDFPGDTHRRLIIRTPRQIAKPAGREYGFSLKFPNRVNPTPEKHGCCPARRNLFSEEPYPEQEKHGRRFALNPLKTKNQLPAESAGRPAFHAAGPACFKPLWTAVPKSARQRALR